MGGGPPPRIPPYMSGMRKKGGTVPSKKFWEKNLGKGGVQLEHPHPCMGPLL